MQIDATQLAMLLGGVFKATGNASPVSIPAKGRWMFADIERWAATVQSCAGCSDVFVYFKHEDAGKGPEMAKRFLEFADQ